MAVEMTLRRIDLADIAPDFQDVAEIYTINNALDWQLDASAALDIETRLRSYGFDQHSISMEVYVQAREILSLFESLLNGARLRCLPLIRKINALRNPDRRRPNRSTHRTALQQKQSSASAALACAAAANITETTSIEGSDQIIFEVTRLRDAIAAPVSSLRVD